MDLELRQNPQSEFRMIVLTIPYSEKYTLLRIHEYSICHITEGEVYSNRVDSLFGKAHSPSYS